MRTVTRRLWGMKPCGGQNVWLLCRRDLRVTLGMNMLLNGVLTWFCMKPEGVLDEMLAVCLHAFLKVRSKPNQLSLKSSSDLWKCNCVCTWAELIWSVLSSVSVPYVTLQAASTKGDTRSQWGRLIWRWRNASSVVFSQNKLVRTHTFIKMITVSSQKYSRMWGWLKAACLRRERTLFSLKMVLKPE